MIDFRYHLVSLVAVFIALAVGIVLGAGPLREGISDTLEGEISDLRQDRADVRAQAGEARAHAEALDEALGVVAPRAASATLTGVRVAVVLMPGGDRNLGDQLGEAVEEAGGEVFLTVGLQPSWQTAQGQDDAAPLLDELAAGLRLPTLPGVEGPTLPAVLGSAVVGADAPGRTGAWLEALDRLEAEGYLRLAWAERAQAQVEDRRPPDAVLVVSGGLAMPEEGGLDAAAQLALESRTVLVRSIMRLDTPLTVVGAGTVGGAQLAEGGQDLLVLAVRQDRTLRAQASTVDDAEEAAGRLAAVLATGWEVAGQSGHYGLGPQAEVPMPQPPPVRLVTGVAPGDQEQAPEPVPGEGADQDGADAEDPDAPAEDTAATTAP